MKLLSEFLDMDQPYVEGGPHPNAEHFAHGMASIMISYCLLLLIFLRPPEMYSYLRSPFRDLYVYDKMVQVRILPFSFLFGCFTYTLLRLPHSPDFSE